MQSPHINLLHIRPYITDLERYPGGGGGGGGGPICLGHVIELNV